MPRFNPLSLLAAFALALATTTVHAQPQESAMPAPSSAPPIQQTEVQASDFGGTTTTTITRDGRRIEQITLEDGGSRVNELREGGETRQITVQPKNGGAAYDVAPPSNGAGNRSHNGGSGSSGPRSWKLIQF